VKNPIFNNGHILYKKKSIKFYKPFI